MSIQGIGNPQNYYSPDDITKLQEAKELAAQRKAERQRESEALAPKPQEVTMSTDRVDRELESLRAKGLELAKRINASDDEDTRLSLEEQLAQIQNELRQKNNDAYRRQNAEISLGIDVKA